MGHLTELVKLNLLVYGGDEVENFKNNTLFFYQKYQKTDESVKSIRISEIKPGGFYFLHYLDDSNWIKYSPVFVVDFKKFDNQIVLFCINFNFIPLKVRVALFDPYIKEQDFTKKNFFLKVKYDAMYKELRKYGFQYSIMEYNLAQVKLVHKIELDLLPRFLYSQHPKAKYDPKKLIEKELEIIFNKYNILKDNFEQNIHDLNEIWNDVFSDKNTNFYNTKIKDFEILNNNYYKLTCQYYLLLFIK